MDGTAAISRLLEFAGLGPREPTDAADEQVQYHCLGCGSVYEVQYHVCPECGGFSVELCGIAGDSASTEQDPNDAAVD
ncbi:hypothetical protein [Halobellus rufus]|uniref:hypothetical protein n=1 Tax=Halobellus rufus TaxID=1448860 RepID=UPI00067997FF|nr:hypothetical protein [Halobellus rufus]